MIDGCKYWTIARETLLTTLKFPHGKVQNFLPPNLHTACQPHILFPTIAKYLCTGPICRILSLAWQLKFANFAIKHISKIALRTRGRERVAKYIIKLYRLTKFLNFLCRWLISFSRSFYTAEATSYDCLKTAGYGKTWSLGNREFVKPTFRRHPSVKFYHYLSVGLEFFLTEFIHSFIGMNH